MVGVSSPPGWDCIGQKPDRVGCACIFGQTAIVEIDSPGVVVDAHIFQYRPEMTCSLPDQRFIICRAAGSLWHNSPLEIEYAILTPAMFVIADQKAFWIGG